MSANKLLGASVTFGTTSMAAILDSTGSTGVAGTILTNQGDGKFAWAANSAAGAVIGGSNIILTGVFSDPTINVKPVMSNITSINGVPYPPPVTSAFSTIYTSSIVASTIQTASDGFVSTNALIANFETVSSLKASTITTDPSYGWVSTPLVNCSNFSNDNFVTLQSPIGVGASSGTNSGLTVYPTYTTLANLQGLTLSTLSSIVDTTSTLIANSVSTLWLDSGSISSTNASISSMKNQLMVGSTIQANYIWGIYGTGVSSINSSNITVDSGWISSISTTRASISTASISSINSFPYIPFSPSSMLFSSVTASQLFTSSLRASTISSVNIFTSSLSASSINALSTYTSSLFTSSISSFWINAQSLPVAVSASNYVNIAAGNLYPSTVTAGYNMYLISPRVPNLAGKNYIISAQFSISSLTATNDSFVSQIFTTANASPPYTWSATNYSTVRTNTQSGGGSHIQTNSHLYSGIQSATSTIFALGIAVTTGATPTNYPIINAYMNILTNV